MFPPLIPKEEPATAVATTPTTAKGNSKPPETRPAAQSTEPGTGHDAGDTNAVSVTLSTTNSLAADQGVFGQETGGPPPPSAASLVRFFKYQGTNGGSDIHLAVPDTLPFTPPPPTGPPSSSTTYISK
jgi:hypothetical protein